MNRSLLRRLAAVASAATVAGLALPALATTASAAPAATTARTAATAVQPHAADPEFAPVTPPVRLFDTRTGVGQNTSTYPAVSPGPIPSGQSQVFCIGNGSSHVASDAQAYAFNVTAISPNHTGNLRISGFIPSSDTENAPPAIPTTSVINYAIGSDIANGAVVPNSPAAPGCFTVYSDGAAANVAIDVTGYFTDPGEFYGGGDSGTLPVRVADTRTASGGGTIASGSVRKFQVASAKTSGQTDYPRAVVVNVTAINPSTTGNLRIFPDDGTASPTPPTTSNINYIPGVDKSVFDIVPLPASGIIDVYSDGAAVNVAVDLFGELTATSNIGLQPPTRVFDSRESNEIPAGGTALVSTNIPANSPVAIVSVTEVHRADSTGTGNLRVYGPGDGPPGTSTLNYVGKTADVANFAIVPVGNNGSITLYSDGSAIDATVDVVGWFPYLNG